MDIEKLVEINRSLNTTNIKGKEYVEVNQRVMGFKFLFPNGRIYTEVINRTENSICIQAFVYEDKDDVTPLATGIAEEEKGTSFINNLSYVENCETSAVGRALGFIGLGITTSIASFEEVKTSELNDEGDKPISESQLSAIKLAISNKNLSANDVKEMLKEFGVERVSEIKKSDLVKFYQAIERK